VLAFFALEQKAVACALPNATITRAQQHGELMRFVVFWHALTDKYPEWLDFDSKLVDYPELNRVNELGIFFVTIRRRGAAIVRRLANLPSSSWTKAVIDTPKRCLSRSALGTRWFVCAAMISRCVRSGSLAWDAKPQRCFSPTT